MISNNQIHYIVLDGATRTTALRELNIPDILVQVVEYGEGGITLEAWNHVLPDVTNLNILEMIGSIKGLKLTETTLDEARRAVVMREIAGYIYSSPDKILSVSADGDFYSQVELLSKVVKTYERHGEIYRLAQADLEHLISSQHEHSSVMIFPQFTPKEIKNIALSDSKLPAGITRHIIPGRALNVNIPLELLQKNQSIADKNEWLDQWLTTKIVERKVRFYHEPVFVFDE
ncbi:MAG: hypothetical protein IPM69_17685 [Ignavibacteria bacterium]|nr:hypothetical protein [Ignavibacteria bacterium]